ncbi:hypothetical protein RI367_007396 [Sorochytrium milnesiophthora]
MVKRPPPLPRSHLKQQTHAGRSDRSNAKDDCFAAISVLQKYQHSKEASALLEKAASMVRPLMRTRQWKVGKLEEFFPGARNLLGLNVNRGQRVCIRLRPASDSNAFYDLEHVVGTLMHELTHIVHGPHDARFYKLLDTLQDEYDALVSSGYSGEGFHSNGHRVGQGVSHNVPAHLSRQQALAAAEKRRQMQQLMLPSGGRRLDDGQEQLGKRKRMDDGQVRRMAGLAAEQRMRDSVWCGNTPAEEHDRAVNAASSSIAMPVVQSSSKPTEVVEISDEDDDNEEGWPCLQCTFSNRDVSLCCAMCMAEQPFNSDQTQQSWRCAHCTLDNPATAPTCQMCLAERVPHKECSHN